MEKKNVIMTQTRGMHTAVGICRLSRCSDTIMTHDSWHAHRGWDTYHVSQLTGSMHHRHNRQSKAGKRNTQAVESSGCPATTLEKRSCASTHKDETVRNSDSGSDVVVLKTLPLAQQTGHVHTRTCKWHAHFVFVCVLA